MNSDTEFRHHRLALSSFLSFSCSSQVTLGKVLKVIVVMRSLFIDRTIVKGYNENVYTEDGKVGYGPASYTTLHLYLLLTWQKTGIPLQVQLAKDSECLQSVLVYICLALLGFCIPKSLTSF